MKKILFISIGLNILILGSSFTTSARSKIINDLEDLREWMVQDQEAALDHGDAVVAEHIAQYMEAIDGVLDAAQPAPAVAQPEFDHFVDIEDAKVVRNGAGEIQCVWVDGKPFLFSPEVLDNL